MKLFKHILFFILFDYIFLASISPYINYKFNSNSELYAINNQDLNYLSFGLNLKHTSNNINFNSNFSYHLYSGINKRPNNFNSKQGFGYLENNPGLSSKQFNYFFTSMRISYNKETFTFYAALDNPLWGPGINKIVISDKVPPFFNIGYKWNISNRLNYEHLYGKLNSLIEDTSNTNIYDEDPSRYPQLPRIIAAHKIDYSITNSLDVGVFEIIVHGGSRSIEGYYLLPFVPFLPIQTYLGDLDNDLLGGYFDIDLNNNLNAYGTLMIDEWTPPYTFKKEHKNWVIYNIGFNKKNILIEKLDLIVEYTWSDNRVYRHKFPINDYYSYNYSLGFWAGPHAENFLMRYQFSHDRYKTSFEFSNTIRGSSISGYNNNFVERYSGMVESKKRYTIHFEYHLTKLLSFNLGYSYIDWSNAGFDPFIHGNQVLEDLIKNDIYLNINYSFNEYEL